MYFINLQTVRFSVCNFLLVVIVSFLSVNKGLDPGYVLSVVM